MSDDVMEKFGYPVIEAEAMRWMRRGLELMCEDIPKTPGAEKLNVKQVAIAAGASVVMVAFQLGMDVGRRLESGGLKLQITQDGDRTEVREVKDE